MAAEYKEATTMKKGYGCLMLLIINIQPIFADTPPPSAAAIELARDTLISQKKLLLRNLTLESSQAMQWPDSSLGCPQPGMMYAQVLTSGFQVTFSEAPSGHIHYVHIGNGRAVVCDKTASTRSQTEKNLHFGQRWQQSQKAQQLLADRLSVDRNEIRIVGARSMDSKKAGSLCVGKINKGEPATSQIQVIELNHRNQVYRYGVINNRLVACD